MSGTTASIGNRDDRAVRRRSRALVVVAAVVAAVAVWVVVAVLVGVDLRVVQGGSAQTVGLGSVVAATAVATLLGWALLAVLERRSRRPLSLWTVVAVVVTLLSLAGPLVSAGTAAAAASLALMHLVVGAVAILGFRRTAR